MAFALEMDTEEAQRTLQRPDDIIMESGKAWIPLEITETQAGFLDAWQKGAQEWRESLVRNEAAFIPVRQAWKAFKPVGLPGASPAIRMPAEPDLLARCSKETALFVDREISARVARLQQEIAAASGNPKPINKLGVLYARYGQIDKAEKEFLRILAREEYVPALVNLGNLSFLRADMQKSITYFGRAFRKEPNNPSVLLGLSRAYYERGDAQQAGALFARLQEAAPDLALKHAYLRTGSTEGARAGQAGAGEGRIEWAED